MRSFEVPACGGIMLAQDSCEHRAFFERGREAFFFKNAKEMIELVHYILSLPKLEADAVRVAARHRSIRGRYNYKERALDIFAEIERLFVRPQN
jgi:spore maturation protein CgeB